MTSKAMMKITKIANNFNLVCPCCREQVLIQIETYDDGKRIASIIHKDEEPQSLDLSAFGLEFGVKGGET